MAEIELKGIDGAGKVWRTKRWLGEYPESHQTLFFAIGDDGRRTLIGGMLAKGAQCVRNSGRVPLTIHVLGGTLVLNDDETVNQDGPPIAVKPGALRFRCITPVVFGCSFGD